MNHDLRWTHLAILLLLSSFSIAAPQSGARATADGGSDWQAYGRDPGGSRYSPLNQISRENVRNLQPVWSYRTGDWADGQRTRSTSAFQSTPIMVDGTLFLATPFNRVIALDPATGKEKWTYDPKIDLRVGYDNQLNCRGLATWLDTRARAGVSCRRRILMGTNDARLIALDAATGVPCAGFGSNGEVDLKPGVGIKETGEYAVTSPPAVIGDVVVVGSAIGDNQRVDAPSGVVRGYDARSGKLRWSWDPVPPGFNKKPADGATYTLGTANVWSMISADPERDLVFLPTGNTSPDYYGGERNGLDYYSSSVVALRGSTGKVVWRFQTVHHDVWDYDVPAQPALITVRCNNREIPAVAVATKMGHLFILERETGKPIHPVEERDVPQGGVEGEKLSRTQPIPTRPTPLVPQKLTPEDAFGLDDQDREWCRERIRGLHSEGPFTPPGLKETLVYPGDLGGMNWSGVSFDPVRGLLVTNTNRLARIVSLVTRDKRDTIDVRARRAANLTYEAASQSGTPYIMQREMLLRFRPGGFLPCNPPPWGTLTAVDVSSGEVRWEIPLGTMPELAQIPESASWGSLNLGGSITTAGGLVFIAAARDNYLRAFDVDTGRELWKGNLPAGGQATPMTYSVNGRQYVVIAAGGHGRLLTKLGDHLVAFALPDTSR